MDTTVLPLSELLDWFEARLEARAAHIGERVALFATDARVIEFSITADGLRVAGVTNYSLPHDQWLDERDVVKLAVLGWTLDVVDEAAPRYVCRWDFATPTDEIVTNVMRALTIVYLREDTIDIVVDRAGVTDGRRYAN